MGTISVSHLGKAYKQYASRWSRLAEWLIPFYPKRHTLKWILQDINFSVQPGEAVGIIGINGAGKSTLLKMITGTTLPTTGQVHMTGRVAAMLELGMGFHPDFTGRQNAFMAGQLLGYTPDEIQRLIPEIEAFAEIGSYIDEPVRVYSSGMQVRLAFSVATAIRPDILIVDEALSVGDRYFSQKSFARIQRFLEQGTTLLLVSHDATAIKTLCDKAILLEGGKISLWSDPETVIDRYNGIMLENSNKLNNTPTRITTEEKTKPFTPRDHGIDDFKGMHAQIDIGEIQLIDFKIYNKRGKAVISITTGDKITIKYKLLAKTDTQDLYFGISIRNNLGVSIFNTNSYALRHAPLSLKKGEIAEIVYEFGMPISPGYYGICMGAAAGGNDTSGFDRYILNIINAEVLEVTGSPDGPRFGGIVDLAPDHAVYKLQD